MDLTTYRKHVISSLVLFLQTFSLVLCIIIESYIFIWKYHPIHHLIPASCMLLLPTIFSRQPSSSSRVYLVDLSCLKPSARLRVPKAKFLEHLSLMGCFDRESVDFMAKVISSSGLSDETCLPSPLHYIPPRTHHDDCIQEAHTLLFPVLEDLFSKTTISPRDVDVLVLNCSGFCPSPSLSAIIVNGFAMHQRVKTFNISGMGCSASAISLDVARTLLQVHRGSYAVVVSTEVLSTGWYPGKDRRKLLLNCSFRTGSAAVLLSSKNEARGKSKYKLLHLVRSQRASDDKAYQSAIREEDSEGITGFTLERIYLKQVIKELLQAHVRDLGCLILPFKEKANYVMKVAMAVLYFRAILSGGKTPVPDFLSAVQHYCMPASWKAVIEEVGRGLGVGPNEMDPALTTFRRFGNQSSSSMWYQLAYLEAKGRVSKGERVWQLAIGSGPKCNSLVWEYCMN